LVEKELIYFSEVTLVEFFNSQVVSQIQIRDHKLNEFIRLISQLEHEIDVVTKQRKQDLKESETPFYNSSLRLEDTDSNVSKDSSTS
jgi:uncharacterized protein Yka (UPF0111/DUF47 family)